MINNTIREKKTFRLWVNKALLPKTQWKSTSISDQIIPKHLLNELTDSSVFVTQKPFSLCSQCAKRRRYAILARRYPKVIRGLCSTSKHSIESRYSYQEVVSAQNLQAKEYSWFHEHDLSKHPSEYELLQSITIMQFWPQSEAVLDRNSHCSRYDILPKSLYYPVSSWILVKLFIKPMRSFFLLILQGD